MISKFPSGTWDRGLNFLETYEKLRFLLTSKSIENKKFRDSPSKRTKIAILLIALRNGSRIGEAVAAYREFNATKSREVQVEVEKRQRHFYDITNHNRRIDIPAKHIMRLMIIPNEVDISLPPYVHSVNNISVFCYETLGHNAHSLRYAWISYMGKKGKSPQLLAKITGHATLDQILHYTQQKEAENTLKNEVLN